MSQFPQQGFQQQPAFGQPAQQPQGFQQQGNFQQQRPLSPQLPQVPMGQGYAPGQFPYENSVTMIGQVFPNQWVPNGLVFSPSQNGGVLRINVKLRQTLGRDQSKVKVTFVTVVAFGQLAQQLQNSVRAGQLIKFSAEYQAGKYTNKKTGKVQSQIQFVLTGQQGQSPLQVIGELPLYDEVAPQNPQGGQWNGGQQGGQQWGQQPPAAQQPVQQWGAQQAPPQAPPQNFQPQQPAPGQWGQQPPQQAPQPQVAPQQGQWQQPQGQYPQQVPQQQMQPTPNAAQPQFGAPGQQFNGGFTPPGAGPMMAQDPAAQQGQPMQGQMVQGGLPGLGKPPF